MVDAKQRSATLQSRLSCEVLMQQMSMVAATWEGIASFNYPRFHVGKTLV